MLSVVAYVDRLCNWTSAHFPVSHFNDVLFCDTSVDIHVAASLPCLTHPINLLHGRYDIYVSGANMNIHQPGTVHGVCRTLANGAILRKGQHTFEVRDASASRASVVSIS